MSRPTVHARDLCRRYGRRWALARVDLDLQPGERLLVVGANGGGKTTLLRVLSTATQPTRGTLSLFGLDPARQPEAVRRKLALLTHLPSLYDDLSGSENLRILARLLRRSLDVRPWLEQVGLDDRPDPVRSYSAGMRKRLSFARLLLQEPALALIDEPYGQLDPEGFRLVDRLVAALAQGGTTVVMASHLVERAAGLCDHGLLLHQGLPRWSGPASDAPKAWSLLHRSAQ
ncbi:MAG: heme ABC exporter ATP-binding protein CcmA [Pseudomonadota bacterium]